MHLQRHHTEEVIAKIELKRWLSIMFKAETRWLTSCFKAQNCVQDRLKFIIFLLCVSMDIL